MAGARSIARKDRHQRQKVRKAARRLRLWLRVGATLVLLALFFSDSLVRRAAEDRVFASLSSVPIHDFGLVLGTSPRSRGGRPNPFFVRRMDAAAALYGAGVIRAVVVSGDNSNHNYNEPAAMRQALIDRGVPEDRIWQDFAGFRTLDSVVRMREVFGQPRFIVVSQRFHLERALFLAEHFGVEAIGFAADGAINARNVRVRLREYPARVKALLDVYLLGTQPRSLGEPIDTDLPPEEQPEELVEETDG